MSELNRFLKVFEEDVAPFYQKHEETFDLESFHGRFHILRCLFLVDALDQFYKRFYPGKYAIEKSYYAILFHDIAREGNGYDEWEEESACLCFEYLVSKGVLRSEAFEVSELILKKQPFTLEGQIVYDVDVLDYNRFFFLPEEAIYFKEEKFIAGSKTDFHSEFLPNERKKLIELSQALVIYSEKLKITTPTKELIEKMYTFYKDKSNS